MSESNAYCYACEDVAIKNVVLTEINKVLTEALDFYAKHHHHMNTTAPNFALEALAKTKEITKEMGK